LKDQAKDLLKTGAAATVADAQFRIARLYGFASWPKLRAHVESFEEMGQLKQAIDTNDIARVKTMMTRNPALHSAPLGYGKDGPLTWVAECRVPWEPPSPARLAMAEWMIAHGSDVHQGGDGPPRHFLKERIRSAPPQALGETEKPDGRQDTEIAVSLRCAGGKKIRDGKTRGHKRQEEDHNEETHDRRHAARNTIRKKRQEYASESKNQAKGKNAVGQSSTFRPCGAGFQPADPLSSGSQ